MLGLRRPALLFIVWTCLCAGPGAGGTKELMEEVYHSSLPNQSGMTRSERNEFGEAILQYWQNIEARIPVLSPKEDEWLKSELSGNSERVSRAINSKEFALDQAGQIVALCVKAAQDLLDKQLLYAKTPNLETFGWSKVARCYANSFELASYLGMAGLSNGRADGEFYFVLHGPILDRVLEGALLSSLAEAEGWMMEGKTE